MIDYRKRVDSLKTIEVLCYSLCIHLLAEEVLAANAAKAALLDLFGDEQFWKLEGSEREQRVRKQAIRRSLECLANLK